ncbi:MAG: hypothetical protein QXX32_04205 [Thermofilum sp.]|uniref:Nucleotidyltransferase domain-containing protein n=1 Tax=Thermofilum adornatum TaxID=1365176 RepID=S6A622_9CREN|nr:hypothetical protein [Thermofilum adornatum]AGT36072.1 hypothetical protein N186_08680 [Thermofilum adornatum]
MNKRRLKEPYQSLLDELVKALHEKPGDDLVSVVIYGSAARGEATLIPLNQRCLLQ